MTGRTTAKTACTITAALLLLLAGAIRAEDTTDQDPGNTLDNLQTVYSSESNDNATNLAYAKRADDEGFGKIASLFRAAARGEQVRFEHAAMIISDLGGVPMADIKVPPIRDTRENLEAAGKGESYESKEMYPQFLRQANIDNVPDAIDLFDNAQQAEAAAAALYGAALKDLAAWKTPNQDFFVCPVCGAVYQQLPAESCAVCSTPVDECITVR